MPDYKEEQLTGKKWVRSDGFVGTNLYEQIPTLTFSEEIRRELADGTKSVLGYGHGLTANMSTPDKIIALRNPLTDELLPDAFELPKTYAGVQIFLYSLYRQLAIERDDAGIVPDEYVKLPFMNYSGVLR